MNELNNPIILFRDSTKKNRDKNILKNQVLSLADELIEQHKHFYVEGFECNKVITFKSNLFNAYVKSLTYVEEGLNNYQLNQYNEIKKIVNSLTKPEVDFFNQLILDLGLKSDSEKVKNLYSFPFNDIIDTILFISDKKDKNGKNYYLSIGGEKNDLYFKTHIQNEYLFLNYMLTASISKVRNIYISNSWNKDLKEIQFSHWIEKNENILSYKKKNHINGVDPYNKYNKNLQEFVKMIPKLIDSNDRIGILNEKKFNDFNDLIMLSDDKGLNLPFKIKISKNNANKLTI